MHLMIQRCIQSFIDISRDKNISGDGGTLKWKWFATHRLNSQCIQAWLISLKKSKYFTGDRHGGQYCTKLHTYMVYIYLSTMFSEFYDYNCHFGLQHTIIFPDYCEIF